MIWEWVFRWLHPRGGIRERDAHEDILTNETLRKLQLELNRLEKDIEAITVALCHCEEALSSLLHKEVRLREEFEEIVMGMHDTVSGELEETINNDTDSIDSVQQLLKYIQQDRERLQDRGYRLHVKLQYLKAEKKTVAESTNILMSRLLGNTGVQHMLLADNEDNDDGGWKPVIHSPPVMVRLVEEYRDEEGTEDRRSKHVP
ncbi:hypothetical protein TraAM80_02355 [Trypanosoma rangeli]|uniref:Uncharacterized protein n=1 Tax=Trypanosoma rangeli TaxID=5698 RepID=A0A3R7MW37_TRYRA|nr:uncharacterized protein TraAM80_02355 [Trypanosoma rangeli]RNF08948.1 hypothetical protein TraAM80_02355 [Trypanosoma rangeli]|eukprot:RNF08948.1 hypothetical protein TraAM80_02355 [Trypanosoma rangeli]